MVVTGLGEAFTNNCEKERGFKNAETKKDKGLLLYTLLSKDQCKEIVKNSQISLEVQASGEDMAETEMVWT